MMLGYPALFEGGRNASEHMLCGTNSIRLEVACEQAIDEHWKSGFDGDNPLAKAEKSWGFYRSDRSPERALA